MTVDVQRLGSSPLTREWIEIVFSEQSNMDSLQPNCRNSAFRDELFSDICSNRILGLIPAVDGVGAGLFYGSWCDGGFYTVHQFVMPRFRGWPAFACARACAVKAFEILTDVTHLVGFIPANNRASIICAKKAGFHRCGVIPEMHDGAGCVVMVRKRG